MQRIKKRRHKWGKGKLPDTSTNTNTSKLGYDNTYKLRMAKERTAKPFLHVKQFADITSHSGNQAKSHKNFRHPVHVCSWSSCTISAMTDCLPSPSKHATPFKGKNDKGVPFLWNNSRTLHVIVGIFDKGKNGKAVLLCETVCGHNMSYWEFFT